MCGIYTVFFHIYSLGLNSFCHLGLNSLFITQEFLRFVFRKVYYEERALENFVEAWIKQRRGYQEK